MINEEIQSNNQQIPLPWTRYTTRNPVNKAPIPTRIHLSKVVCMPLL